MSNVDFIPVDDKGLCEECIFYEECPYTYVCPTLRRLIDFEEEKQEEL